VGEKRLRMQDQTGDRGAKRGERQDGAAQQQ
jgi:hypothetical protein